MKYLAIALLLVACDVLGSEPAKHAQVETARVSQEIACSKHLKRLLDLRDEGKSCEEAKRQASIENPLCNLSFSCKVRDAGLEDSQ